MNSIEFAQRAKSHVIGTDLLIIGGIGLLWSLLLMTGWFDGIYTSDELIYAAAIATFQEQGSLVIENGYQAYGSDVLKLWFLVAGPNGLVPQYPSGFTVLAAPFHAIGGLRGVMVLNVAAAIATLCLCRLLVLRLFDDKQLARLAVLILAAATFLVDYALAIWPHALSAVAVTTAIVAAAGIETAERPKALRAGLMVGCALSLGLLIRVDVAFAAPAIVLWMILYALRPIHAIGGVIIGALPGLVLGTFLNLEKFGLAVPISYGQTGGGTDPLTYIGFVPVLFAVLALCLMLRHSAWRRRLSVPAMISGAVLIAAAGALVPELRGAAARFVHGAYVLLVDLGTTDQAGKISGIVRDTNGIVWFYGLAKKALVQSLPWLAVLPLLASAFRRKQMRPGLGLCSLVCAVWIFPFAWFEWHGGIANNLRYFVPIVPLLAILGAAALREVSHVRLPDIWPQIVVSVLAVFAVAAGIYLFASDNLVVAAQRDIPLVIAATLFTASAAFVVAPAARPATGHAVRLLFWSGFVVAALSSNFFDLSANQARRTFAKQLEANVESVPSDSLVVAYFVESFLGQLVRKDGLLAFPGRLDQDVDTGLIRAVLADGKRVFVQGELLSGKVLGKDPALAVREPLQPLGKFALREIVFKKATDVR